MREHRNLTLLLNLLLKGRTSLLRPRSTMEYFWASVDDEGDKHRIAWVRHFFFADLGPAVIDELSAPIGEELEMVAPEEYYAQLGHDAKGLRVPTDLDDSICLYLQLSPKNHAKFGRSLFWIDVASHQWNLSMSASFASLVSAIESLTERGDIHQFNCPVCAKPAQHEVPGATRRFKDFFEAYAPGAALATQRDKMYSLRSGILHGSNLMQLDQDRIFGWDPPWWNERELYDDLWGLTRTALRNWLRNPSNSARTKRA